MKNHKVYLKTFVPGEGKDEQDEGMIYLTTSMTEKNRRQNNVTALRQEIKGFIKCLIDAVLSFYLIRLRPNDLKRDLVENIITNMILKDEIYKSFLDCTRSCMKRTFTVLDDSKTIKCCFNKS